MPLRWHAHLPGPIAYSRPLRKKRRGSGPLTSVLVWFIVKPLELIFKGLASLFRSKQPVVPTAARTSSWPMLGWYCTQYGPMYWNGAHWFWPDGRAAF